MPADKIPVGFHEKQKQKVPSIIGIMHADKHARRIKTNSKQTITGPNLRHTLNKPVLDIQTANIPTSAGQNSKEQQERNACQILHNKQ